MDLAALSALLAILGNAGASVLLAALIALIIVGLFRKWWVPGWMYEQVERQATDADATIKTLSAVIASALRADDDARPPAQRRGDQGTSGYDRRAPRR